MRLLTLPITIARVPIELGFGAAKQAVKFAHGLVGGGGEEPVAEEPRPEPPPRRRRTSSRARARSGNGRARSGTGGRRASRRTAEPSGRVAEAAEPGAEDGAGAEVAVGEPWSGYDERTAADIEDRLLTEGPEAAAAVS